MLLLPDGNVMAQQEGMSSVWYRLTPDVHGSYINGTWTTLAPMHYSREFYSSAVLRDGRVFVAGGEYGTSGNTAEIYDPRLNTWTEISVPAGLLCGSPDFSDSASVILPNGNVMISPVHSCVSNGTVIYNPTLNSFSKGPVNLKDQNEATWVKLPDDVERAHSVTGPWPDRLATITMPIDGVVEFVDTMSVSFPESFYRTSTD